MRRMTSDLPAGNQQSSRTQSIAITAILLFALSGLMVGFAFGAVNRPRQSGPDGSPVVENQQTATQEATQAVEPTVSPTQNQAPVEMGCPAITVDAYFMPPDGVTPHTASGQAVDKGYASGESCINEDGTSKGNPLMVSGITFRLVLMKTSDKNAESIESQMRDVNEDKIDIQQPFPNEIQGGLVFNGSSAVLTSNNQGKVEWQFTLSTSISKGTYDLIVIARWDHFYNYSWKTLTVEQ